MSATILYLNPLPGNRTHEMTLAGIRRYAEARGWRAESIPQQDSRPKNISTLLASHRPVIGYVVECSDDNSLSSPHLFDDIPAVFLHPPPPLRNGRVACVTADNEAIVQPSLSRQGQDKDLPHPYVAFLLQPPRRCARIVGEHGGNHENTQCRQCSKPF